MLIDTDARWRQQRQCMIIVTHLFIYFDQETAKVYYQSNGLFILNATAAFAKEWSK